MFSLARITSDRKNHGIRKLISGSKLFNFQKSSYSLIPYKPESLLEEGHLYTLENASKLPFFPPWMDKLSDSKNFANLEEINYPFISFIIEVDLDKNISFQVASNNTYIKKKPFIKFSEIVKLEEKSTIFIVRDEPDVFYEKNTDLLIFKNLSSLDKIFRGANILFKEATSTEVSVFLCSNFIKLENGFNTDKVSILNRKKITSCNENFFKLTPVEQQIILKETQKYRPNLFCSKTKKFKISSDNELKDLLYGLDERFFTTTATKKKAIANSVIAA